MTVTCITEGCPCEGIDIEIPESWTVCTCGGCGVDLLAGPPPDPPVIDNELPVTP
jgi:hypothetical protein